MNADVSEYKKKRFLSGDFIQATLPPVRSLSNSCNRQWLRLYLLGNSS